MLMLPSPGQRVSPILQNVISGLDGPKSSTMAISPEFDILAQNIELVIIRSEVLMPMPPPPAAKLPLIVLLIIRGLE